MKSGEEKPTSLLPGDCPICLSARSREVYAGEDEVVARFGKGGLCRISLRRCRDCGMMFLGNLDFTPEEVHEAYWNLLQSSSLASYSVDPEARIFRPESLDPYRRLNRVLEIGCGEGALLRLLRERGWSVAGTDIALPVVELARRRHGIEVIRATLDERLLAALGEGSFDAVIMWGLLEHLPAPLPALRLCHRLLRPGGGLVVYTPNAGGIFHRLAWLSYRATAGRCAAGMKRVIVAMHRIYFTPRTLRAALAASGFRLASLSPVDIDLKHVFSAPASFRWSNRGTYWLARALQRAGSRLGLNSHLLAVAEREAAE